MWFLVVLQKLILQVQALLETSIADCVNGEGQGSLKYRLGLAEKVLLRFDAIMLGYKCFLIFLLPTLLLKLIVAISELAPPSDWSRKKWVKLRAWKVIHYEYSMLG